MSNLVSRPMTLRALACEDSSELAAGQCDGRKGAWGVHKQARRARSARGSPPCSHDAKGREEGEGGALKVLRL